MHIVIATLYGLVVWVALLAYAVIVGGPWGKVLAFGPLVVSGIIAVVIAADMALAWIIKRFRRRD
jgi:membrane protein DedA with SNARE-associated domain